MHPKYSCRICDLEVKNSAPSDQCDLCDKWVHTTCADMCDEKYEKLKQSLLPWYCPTCTKEIQISQINNKELHFLYSTKPPPTQSIKLKKIDKKNKEILKNFKN